MSDERPVTGTPFHGGELALQDRLGVRDRVGRFAARAIVDRLPNQHRAFYEQLPFALLGSLDARGRPWASLLAGDPGFLSSPDPQRLQVAALPFAGDPAADNLAPGAPVGLLGIDLETRRRNRLSGRVVGRSAEGFDIAVHQAFGNCPQYIQSRRLQPLEDGAPPGPRGVSRATQFDSRAKALIAQADTLFIASAAGAAVTGAAQGVDVSHRGGKPGFVRLEDDRTFLLPDFAGNRYFNTLGNILLNPKCGFLFVDFAGGSLLSMTGAAEIIWDAVELRAFAGAERLLRFQAEEVVRLDACLPFRFVFDSFSPSLARTGQWT